MLINTAKIGLLTNGYMRIVISKLNDITSLLIIHCPALGNNQKINKQSTDTKFKVLESSIATVISHWVAMILEFSNPHTWTQKQKFA